MCSWNDVLEMNYAEMLDVDLFQTDQFKVVFSWLRVKTATKENTPGNSFSLEKSRSYFVAPGF